MNNDAILILLGLLPDIQQTETNNGVSPNTSNELDLNEYMANGERIFTLAKEKQTKKPLPWIKETSDILNLKYPQLEMSSSKNLEAIRKPIKKYIRSKFKALNTRESLETIGIPFLVTLCKTYEKTLNIRLSNCCNIAKNVGKTAFVIEVTLTSTKSIYLPVNPQKRFCDNTYYFKKNPHEKEFVMHLETLFCDLALLSRLSLFINDVKINNSFGNTLKQLSVEPLSQLLKSDWSKCSLPPEFCRYLKDHAFTEGIDTYQCVANETVLCVDPLENLPQNQLFNYAVFEFIQFGKPLSLSFLFSNPTIGLFYSMPFELEKYLSKVFTFYIDTMVEHQQEYLYRKNLNKTVATAYITKKNIPLKVLAAMESSKFNKHFGYVEFDQDTDLTLTTKIEEEFLKVNANVFGGYCNKNVVLRFRKLGKHKAAGLYYPSLNTLCVDIRYPDSFIHEFFHMLDDQFGNLSLEYDFYQLATLYKKEVGDIIMNSDTSMKQRLQANTKYNLSYYFRRTEIFARCAEIHLFRNLGIESSLLKHESKDNFSYPYSPELNNSISAYFEKFLQDVKSLASKEHL